MEYIYPLQAQGLVGFVISLIIFAAKHLADIFDFEEEG